MTQLQRNTEREERNRVWYVRMCFLEMRIVLLFSFFITTRSTQLLERQRQLYVYLCRSIHPSVSPYFLLLCCYVVVVGGGAMGHSNAFRSKCLKARFSLHLSFFPPEEAVVVIIFLRRKRSCLAYAVWWETSVSSVEQRGTIRRRPSNRVCDKSNLTTKSLLISRTHSSHPWRNGTRITMTIH